MYNITTARVYAFISVVISIVFEGNRYLAPHTVVRRHVNVPRLHLQVVESLYVGR